MEEDEESSLNEVDDLVFDPELDNQFSERINKMKRRLQGGGAIQSENMDDEEGQPEIASIHESP